MDWSRDGRILIRDNTRGSWDIWEVPADAERLKRADGPSNTAPPTPAPRPVVQSQFDERKAQLTRDARWMAYESNESGRFEIYVQPFPGPGAKVLVSSGGGSQPRWRSDGRELYYVSPDARLMAVSIRSPDGGRALEVGRPAALFQARIESTVRGGITHEYAVSADGQRFLLNAYAEQAGVPMTLILNAFAGAAR
jgi:Tol biopolymer transport system component